MLQTLFAFWAIWWFKKIFSRKKRRIEKFKKWKWKLLFYEQWLFAIIIIHNGKKLNSGNSTGFINWCVKKRKNTDDDDDDDNLALKVFYFLFWVWLQMNKCNEQNDAKRCTNTHTHTPSYKHKLKVSQHVKDWFYFPNF